MTLSKFNGKVIRYGLQRVVKVVRNNTKHAFDSAQEFMSQGFDFSEVVVIEHIEDWFYIEADCKLV